MSMKHPHAKHRTPYAIKMQLLQYLTKMKNQNQGILVDSRYTIPMNKAASVMETSHRQSNKFVFEMVEQGLIEVDRNALEFKISITPKGVEIGQYLVQLNAMIAKLPKEFR